MKGRDLEEIMTVKKIHTALSAILLGTLLLGLRPVFAQDGQAERYTFDFRGMTLGEAEPALRLGQMSRVGGDAPPSAPAPVSVEQMLIWRDGGFFFIDHPVAVILAEAERRFGIAIDAPDVLAQQRQTLFLRQPETLDTILDVLCASLDCRYRATPNGYEVVEANGQ